MNHKAMNEHEKIRELLPLAAAGALDAAEESRLAAHLRICPDCAAALSSWQEIQSDLRRIPTPQAPASLVALTILLAQNQLIEEFDRRAERRIIAVVLVFSWIFVAVSWPLAQFLGHGWMTLLGSGFRQGWENFAIFTALCWVAGAAAAILLAARKQREKRIA
jgi:anti-sigma factor RsiW